MGLTKTLTMVNATGYTVTIVPLGTTKDDFVPTSITLTAVVACWVKFTDWNASTIVAPTAPSATPAPGAGATTDYYHMAAGETREFGLKRQSLFVDPSKYGAIEYFQFIQVWSEGAGDLKLVAY